MRRAQAFVLAVAALGFAVVAVVVTMAGLDSLPASGFGRVLLSGMGVVFLGCAAVLASEAGSRWPP